MGVLKHFAPWDTFCSGGEGVLNYLEPKIYKDFEWYQVFIIKYFKYFEIFWSKKSDKKIHTQFSLPKCFNISMLSTTDAYFYNLPVKIGSISFFSSSDTLNIHNFLRCYAIDINSSFNLFLSALRFSNLLCQEKSLIWTMVSGSFKISFKNTHFITKNATLLESSLK